MQSQLVQRYGLRRITGAVTAAVGLVAMMVGVSPGSVAGIVDTQQVPLHNTDAGHSSDCPDEVNDYWHFVIAPNNDTYGFESITLDLESAVVSFTGGEIIPNGDQTDNVFVQVPAPHDVGGIVQDGSYAAISPSTGDPKFVLSHVCDGAGTPTTTTTTTSTSTSSSTTSTTTSNTVPCEWNPQLPAGHPDCVPSTTTTSTPTATTTTTTTATVPCEWNPQLPAGDPNCIPSIDVAALCFDIDTSGAVERYWHRLINNEATDIAVAWIDGNTTLPGNGSVLVSSGQPSITLTAGGDEVAATPTPADEHCRNDVRITKVVDGPADDGAVYTIQISRLVGVDYVPEGGTYELVAGETIEVPLPSTFNPEGVNYRIEEVDAGNAHANSVTPDSFILNGHKNETISVVVENAFAAISIEKTVSTTAVEPGGEVVYTLVAENTGALTLDPVVIYDRLPPEVFYSDGHSSIVGDAGTCTLEVATRPQLVRCELDDALATGEFTAAIDLLVIVDPDIDTSAVILNQAMSIGVYDDDDLVGDVTNSARGAFGESRWFIEQASTDLSCDPAPGEVCDLSATIGVSVVVPSNTTTSVAQLGPTTTSAQSLSPTTTTARDLPRTGSDSNRPLVLLGAVLVLLGGVMQLGSRRTRQLA